MKEIGRCVCLQGKMNSPAWRFQCVSGLSMKPCYIPPGITTLPIFFSQPLLQAHSVSMTVSRGEQVLQESGLSLVLNNMDLLRMNSWPSFMFQGVVSALILRCCIASLEMHSP